MNIIFKNFKISLRWAGNIEFLSTILTLKKLGNVNFNQNFIKIAKFYKNPKNANKPSLSYFKTPPGPIMENL